jgi:hypothetical protein
MPLMGDFPQLIELRVAQAEIINVVLHIFPDAFFLIRIILVDRMGIEPIDSDLARITRNPITQPVISCNNLY